MHQYFNEICEFRQTHPVKKGEQIHTNSPVLESVKQSLSRLKSELETKFSQYNNINFTVKESQGSGNFPNILHLCILPPNQKVSDGIYVGIGFDKFGRGAVVGCMESKSNSRGLNTKQRKFKNEDLRIDVDGGNANTKYNNVFENPKQFYYPLQESSLLVKHIAKSLDLCLYNLNLIDNPPLLQANDYLITNTEEGLFKDFNLDAVQDTRQKIALQINVRRGQKKFRDSLLKSYDNKCAISGCTIVELLEAAHIYPYKGDDTNHLQNGILLRTDLHTLFDLGLMSIHPTEYTVELSDQLLEHDFYKDLLGIKIGLPIRKEDYPSIEVLEYHFNHIFNK
ncbi:HNH endonuclease [Elizabethkingia anophelis]|uniref:HNH nuclease domain-containing protein n=1 Tax=Elizabethkingia anophelis TaxID=1117645 RepID=A0A494J844_9FLAO|nr:HNH endonuclease [Elizabethkingia anophelis]AQX51318.1 hypothetical protein AYC66_11795 [Elizabethkingia anophelis]MCT4196696.1 HNH endonuclease [Elizabethkingia anophelis]MCT4225360.1 HNH endonuclease [Elizabethkingia anophelis]MCT4306951.1 HNH endonuclease [Elizabethkingia anophelis]MDV2472710.1 HNH endonuclease [Elizabethkingia anophelis]